MAIRTDFTAGEVLAAADLNDTFAAKLNLAGGKILQIVRATDATNRDTTSASFVDANISVTITPQKNTSAVLLIWQLRALRPDSAYIRLQLSDSSNNAVSGTSESIYGTSTTLSTAAVTLTIIGYATPATLSPTTFKGRFNSSSGTATIQNASQLGQLYAIEVSA